MSTPGQTPDKSQDLIAAGMLQLIWMARREPLCMCEVCRAVRIGGFLADLWRQP